jgi:hypothetical protein
MRVHPRTAVVIILGGIGILAGTFGARAQANAEPQKDRGCSDATIEGTYGIQISGTRPSGPGGPMESVIGVVIRTYDGQGQFTQVDNVKGSISGAVPDRQGLGTYQVSEDCSAVTQATVSLNPLIVLEERLVIVNDGNEIRSMTSLPPPVMVTGVHKRVTGVHKRIDTR